MLQATDIEPIVRAALAEDLPWGDITTDTLIDRSWRAHGKIIAKTNGVIAGLPVMASAFSTVDSHISFNALCEDGTSVQAGDIIASLSGRAASILRAERVALNFLQRLSGIATLTAQFVAQIEGLPCRIVDTRKTTPGLRRLQKYAVLMGGGYNHRFSLSDGVMIKDNHLAMLAAHGIGMKEALANMRRQIPHGIKIEIEVDTLEQLAEALQAKADIILLDNMPPATLRQAVKIVEGRALTEASGGITLQTVRAVAETGVDIISVGALTHSAKALDISLDLEVMGR